MKYFVFAFALCLLAVCAVADEAAEPSSEYLPPVESGDTASETKVADDGYRYRTVRRLKYRHRRDVSQEYLPPVQEPTQEYLPPNQEAAETKVADDGYRYKTVRRLKYRRHRRDVSEIVEKPSSDYLPPVEVELAPELKTVVGDDGYRYRTVRRLKYRRRREADAAPEESVAAEGAEAPVNEYLPPSPSLTESDDKPEVKSAELAKDGYRYKTVRRIRYRYRH